MQRKIVLIIACAVVLFIEHSAAKASELRVLAGAAYSSALSVLGPAFERSTGHKLKIRYEISDPTRRLLDSTENFDVYILPQGLFDYAIQRQKVDAATRIAITRVGLAVAVKADAPKPDISSAAGFKQMLLNAKSVTYPPQGFVGKQLEKIIDDFGIADAVKAKAKLQDKVGDVPKAVAAGNAEFGFAPQTILTAAHGIEVVGPFPGNLQSYLVYIGGVGSETHDAAAAKSFLATLTAPPAIAVLKNKGYDIGG